MGCGSSRVNTPPQHTREPSTHNFNKEQTRHLPPKTEKPIEKVPSVKNTEPEVHLEPPAEPTTAPAEPITATSDAFNVPEVQVPSPPPTIARSSTPPPITRQDSQTSFGNQGSFISKTTN